MSGPPPLDIHGLRAGTIAQNTPGEELIRRRKADKLARQYHGERARFGQTVVSVTHQFEEPPRFTKAQWLEEYGDLLELLDESVRANLEKEMMPRMVRHTQRTLTPIEFGVINRIGFRGDTRPPSLIFSTGFARKELNEEIRLGSEKTYGGISSSKSADIVRRKYGNCGEYMYAVWIGSGIDTHDFNKLDEIISVHIEPKHIIGCAGPIYRLSDDACYRLGVKEVRENVACDVLAADKEAVMKTLNQMCTIISTKTKGGAWEV
jgi:hypothetical protein